MIRTEYTVIMKTLKLRRYEKNSSRPIGSTTYIERKTAEEVLSALPAEEIKENIKEETKEALIHEEEPLIEEVPFEDGCYDDPYLLTRQAEINIDQEENKAEKKKKKPRKKLELFEKEAEQIDTLSELEAAINHDGYYNEIRPRDDGEFVRKEKKKVNVAALVAVGIMMIVFAAIFIKGIGGIIS